MKDIHGNEVLINSKIKILSLDPKDFNFLKKIELDEIMTMVNEIFNVHELDEYNQAWVSKKWWSSNSEVMSHSIGLRSNEFELHKP